eukprot:TRINITY_DN2209_c0_g1_i1.p1 TRINITY_DN2209_c0_g1~~TRINITY_DN2209_c0_g1_i1.p1  ORF type:complete len:1057 (-),score=311.91 TRINITY_DN2209_c0_g1_i1:101-3271(-)
MSEEVMFDKKSFWTHLKTLIVSWKNHPALYSNSEVLLLISGDKSQALYSKANALQLWLFGYELPGTAILFVRNSVHVFASAKKVKLLQALGSTEMGLEMNLIPLNKEDRFASNFAAITKLMRASGRKAGVIVEKDVSGEFATTLLAEVKRSGFDIVDPGPGLADAMAVKDETELNSTKKAANFSSQVLKYVVDEFMNVIDSDSKITHSNLADKAEQVFQNPAKIKAKLKAENLESCYTPIIQSGGRYDLKPSAQSNDETLHVGTIICSLGARYKSYCTNIGRTYFINPSDQQRHVYNLLINVYQACLATLRDGVPLSKVWEAAEAVIKREDPKLLNNFTKNCGFAIGLEFREPSLVINSKNHSKARTNMVFNLVIGFSDLTRDDTDDPRAKTYAVLLADTVLVTDDEPEILTHSSRKFSEVSYKISDGDGDAEEKEDGDVKEEKEEKLESKSSRDEYFDMSEIGVARRTRNQVNQKRSATENDAILQKRREHQNELLRKKNDELLRKLQHGELDNKSDGAGQQREAQDIMSYTSAARMPREAKRNQIFVDTEAESVLFPIHGRLVPFHIQTIKSVSKSEEGNYTYLRVNLETPSIVNGKPNFISTLATPNSMFIRELSYRALDPRNLNTALRLIKELKRRVMTRNKEHEEKANLADQDSLNVNKTGAFPRLRDVTVKPVLLGRKNTGILEAHHNGFRFLTAKGAKADIIFSNIKHAFFQSADKKSSSTLVHFHLKQEIMWGKKKTKDVQFYVEVVDASQDLSNARARHQDQDGIQEEQEERILRQKTNERFRDFVKKVEDTVPNFKVAVTGGFDSPYRDLAFTGVPNKQIVELMPTMHCLTALDDQPPFVLSLSEVEVAQFERVQFTLKNFDLVFVFKDWERPVLRISAIPRQHLELLQDYLDTSEVLFAESSVNLDWGAIMKHIREDVEQFWQVDNGWSFLFDQDRLGEPSGAASDGEGSEGSPSESEYEEESDEYHEEDSEEYSSVDEVSESSGSDYEDEDDDESDASWEELERQALEDDEQADREEMEEEDSPRPKKRANKAEEQSKAKRARR